MHRVRAATRPKPGPIGVMLIGSFVLALVYYGYRYPLQYNVTGYGNVYKNTPPALSAGKYVLHLGLLAAMIGLLVAGGRRLVMSRSAVWLFATAATVGVMSFVDGGYAPGLAVPFIFSLLCAGLVSIVVRTAPSAALALWRVAGKLAQAFVLVSAVANVIQMFLYATTGRLPAHGYPGIVIRFGGFWDDPNQSAMFSALVVIVVASLARNRNRRPSRLVVLAGVFNVFVSVSYSGYVSLAIGLIVVYAWGPRATRERHHRRIPWPVLVGCAGVVLLTLAPIDLSPVHRAISGKKDSAELRLSIIYKLEGNTFSVTDVPDPIKDPHTAIATLVRGDGRLASETSVVRLVLLGGIAPLITLIIWMAIALRPAIRATRPWGLAVVLAFLGASFFVPYLVIYPGGLFFFSGVEIAGALPKRRLADPDDLDADGLDVGDPVEPVDSFDSFDHDLDVAPRGRRLTPHLQEATS